MSTNIQVCSERLFLLRIVRVILYDGIKNIDLLENVFSNYTCLIKASKALQPNCSYAVCGENKHRNSEKCRTELRKIKTPKP